MKRVPNRENQHWPVHVIFASSSISLSPSPIILHVDHYNPQPHYSRRNQPLATCFIWDSHGKVGNGSASPKKHLTRSSIYGGTHKWTLNQQHYHQQLTVGYEERRQLISGPFDVIILHAEETREILVGTSGCWRVLNSWTGMGSHYQIHWTE